MIYLGGLGDDGTTCPSTCAAAARSSRSCCDGAPTTALRAGIVIGDGSISWEILRQLVERLPVMITPRWVQTKTQPIALDDALVDLVGVLGRADAIGEIYDIGGPEALTYRDMMLIASRVMDRHRLIAPVPLLSPRLSSHWLRIITDVDLTTARSLVDSMTNEVVVSDRRLDELLGHTPMTFAEAAAKALAARAERRAGRRDPCASLTSSSPPAEPPTVDAPAARRRRRVVVAVTIVVGTALLAATLRVEHGSAWFSVLGLLVAATWTIGSFVSGPIPFQPRPRSACAAPSSGPSSLGVAAFVAFLVAYLVARHLPLVGPALDGVLDTADAGPIAARAARRAGQRRRRGAVLPRRAPRRARAAPAGDRHDDRLRRRHGGHRERRPRHRRRRDGRALRLERLSTRGVLAPIVTHVTWTTLMVLALPR